MPLLSAGAWLFLAGFQIVRDRWHTWTETFFLFACIFAGFYAIGDWLFFNVQEGPASDQRVFLAALISISSLVLAEAFVLLFTLVYVDRMRRRYWLVAVASAGVLLMVWTPGLLITSVEPGPIHVPIFNLGAFLVLLAFVLFCSLVGIYNLYRLYKIVRTSSPTLARRAAGLTIVFTVVLILGLATNGYLGLKRNTEIPPPFSTLLIFVAVAAYMVLFPVGQGRISEVIRRFQARRYSIKAVFLTYNDGTLIGAKAMPGETMIDQDLFGATLDVIQNFMRTSFPILRGKSLSSISHGNYTLVVEQARYTCLTVVLDGEETDQLRRQMRDLLLNFESENRKILEQWRGIPSEAHGTEDLLTAFYFEAPIA